MIIEIIFASIGPNIGFEQVNFVTAESWNMIRVPYNLNDIMLVIMFFRLYIVFRFSIYCSEYYNARAHRVTKMMGSSLTKIFAIRCIFNTHPIKFLIVVVLTLLFGFAYMLKILEGPVWYVEALVREKMMDYNLLENCLWNVLVTMTTVGYGDFYPITNLGRLVCILMAIFGSILISLMTVITSSKIELTEIEAKVYDFCLRLEARKEKEDAFTKYALSCFRYKTAYNKLKNFVKENSENKKDPSIEKEYNRLKAQLEFALYNKINDKKSSKKAFQYEYINLATFEQILIP